MAFSHNALPLLSLLNWFLESHETVKAFIKLCVNIIWALAKPGSRLLLHISDYLTRHTRGSLQIYILCSNSWINKPTLKDLAISCRLTVNHKQLMKKLVGMLIHRYVRTNHYLMIHYCSISQSVIIYYKVLRWQLFRNSSLKKSLTIKSFLIRSSVTTHILCVTKITVQK